MTRLCLAALTCLAVAAPQVPANEVPVDHWVLRGTVVGADSVIEDAAVSIQGQKIESVGPWSPPGAGVRVVETHGFIYPGLIDLHNHLTWNVFPRWSAGRTFPNRYEWQQFAPYLMALDTPHRLMIEQGYGTRMAKYAEVKALAGGVTSLAGLHPGDLPKGTASSYHQMVRMIDLCSGFYPPGAPETVAYQVFPLFMVEPLAAKYRTELTNHQLKALLIHLGEGSPVDAASITEYRILKARGLLLPGVSLIHGVALHRAQFEEMRSLGIGLIWSPRSNFELYGATADIGAAKAAGVTIAIAPDWSPTGSDGLLGELKYAATWNAAQPTPPFDDRALFRMATSEPARLAGADDKIGALKAGLYADILVLARARPDGYAALDHASPADVNLVVVSGQAVYGDDALAKAARPDTAWTRIQVGSAAKSVAFPSAAPGDDWAHTTAALDAELTTLGSHLSPLVE